MSLTEAGETYLGQAGGLLAELDDLDARLSQGASSPVGRLRVSAPVSFGMRYLGRVVAGFHQQYPQIEVELNLNDRRVDLVEEGFDLGLRVSNLSDSSLVARRLARIRDLVVAAPSYLQRCGTPATPADLAEHQCLLYALTTQPNLWDFTAPDGSSGRVKVKGMLRANNGDILTDAAIHGMGVILQPRFLVEQGWPRARAGAAAQRLRLALPGPVGGVPGAAARAGQGPGFCRLSAAVLSIANGRRHSAYAGRRRPLPS
ncbi:LysR substrate-binding domain-containing protein [Chromobacterium haemolyticum]|nr:LysR substrate-binding domain-containing protein [Chromobacterium haemolyticum]